MLLPSTEFFCILLGFNSVLSNIGSVQGGTAPYYL